MTTGEQRFAWQHAAKWAHGPWRTSLSAAEELFADEQAIRYANWYMGAYIRDAGDMADLPAHPHAWDRYLSEQASLTG